MMTNTNPATLVDPDIKARRRENAIVWVARFAIAIAALLLWEVASKRWISEFWISSPVRIAAAFIKMLEDGGLARHLYATIAEALTGFAVGAATGMFAAVLLGANRIVARIGDPFLVAFYSLPRIALIPLFILWFGIGFQTKVIYTSILVFFPVFLNTLAGIRDVNQDLIDVIRLMGASRLDTLKKILMPYALVWLFAGLRISAPYALVGAIVAEMFTSNAGLGFLISSYANQLDTASLFATLFITASIGLLLNELVAQTEKRLLRWKPAS